MARVGEGKGVLEALLGRVRDFDEGYSNKIAAMYDDKNPLLRAASYTVLGGHPSFVRSEPQYKDGSSKLERVMEEISSYAIPAVNAVPKYVLPAAGVTLAGKGLIDMANAINAQLGDRQENGQIPLM